MIGEGDCGAIDGMKIGSKPKQTRPSATLSTTNPTWPDLGSNPGRRGGKPETNRLSYGAAQNACYFRSNYLVSKFLLLSFFVEYAVA
jgi:hypothetical protein